MKRLLLLFIAAVILVAPLLALPSPAHAATNERRIDHAVRVARAQVGDPYVWGAVGPFAFDCSGLVYYSYRRAGIAMPRTASAQAQRARHIHRKNMRRGDLMFFYDGGGVYHVGIYLGWSKGRRLLLHAPYPGRRVHRERVWTNRWFPGTLRN